MNRPGASRRTRTLLLVSAAAPVLGAAHAVAEGQPPGSDRWEVSVTPYVWATALKGDVGVGRTNADVDASFDDILNNLNGALMLSLEARKGRFGLLSDTVYANLEDDAATAADRLKVDATANMLIQSLAATYRLGTWQLTDTGAGPLALTVDPYAGARYTYLNTELSGKLDLPDLGIDAHRDAEQSEHWVDPIDRHPHRLDPGRALELRPGGRRGRHQHQRSVQCRGVGNAGLHVQPVRR